MRIDKLTTQFQEALSDAQSLAVSADNPYIEPIHVLAAIIAQPDGSGRALLERAGVRISALRSSVEAALKNLPQVSGQSSQPQVSRELLKLLTQAEKDAEKRGDQYVAIEMFLLALTEGDGRQGGEAGRLLVQAGLTHKSLQAAVARLVGYTWPAETDDKMELSDEARAWVARSKALASHADKDGIVCIPPVGREASAGDRLLNLRADALGGSGRGPLRHPRGARLRPA